MKYIKVVIVSILLCGVLTLGTQFAFAEAVGNDSELRGGKITFYEGDTTPSTSGSSFKPVPQTNGNSFSNGIKKVFPNTGEKQSLRMKFVGCSIVLLLLIGLLTRYYKKGEYM